MSSKNAVETERIPAGEANPKARSWTLAGRLTAWFIFANAILLSLVVCYLYWSLVDHLDDEDMEHFEAKLEEIKSALQSRPFNVANVETALHLEQFAFEPVYARVLNSRGTVLAETEGLPDWMDRDIYSRAPGSGASKQPMSLRGPDGRPFLLFTATLEARDGNNGPFQVQMALDHALEAKLLARHRRNIIVTLLGGLLVTAVIGHRIAFHGTRPLERFAGNMRQISANTLNERLSATGRPAELTAMVESFNNMLGRLEEAFTRESQFSADIAHELRNPLNNLRGEIEVSLTRTRNSEEYRSTLSSCLEECERLSHMIDRLLFLARAEDPATQIQRVRTDIREHLSQIQEFYAASAHESGIALELESPSSLFAEVDAGLFQRAMVNLVENSLAQTPSGGRILLAAHRRSDQLVVTVRDTGRGIAPEHLPRVFDRLYRVDVSRARRTGGAGLGLSIVKSIAELHGGKVDIESMVGHGTEITLYFPQLPESPEMKES